MGFNISSEDSECGVYGSWLMVQRSKSMVQGPGCRVHSLLQVMSLNVHGLER